MRLDKYLKVSRVIKRRTVACEACQNGRVSVNGKVAKPSADIKVGDTITVAFGDNNFLFKVTNVNEYSKKADAAQMYEIIGGNDESC